MGLFSALGGIVGSFFGPVGTAAGGAIGGAIDQSQSQSSAKDAMNSAMRGQCLTPTVIASRNTDLVSSWIIPISWGRD